MRYDSEIVHSIKIFGIKQTPYLKQLRIIIGHTSKVNWVKFSPDGTKLVSASNDKTACIWDVKSGELLRTFVGHGHCVTRAEFSSSGNTIVTCSNDCTIALWDVGKFESCSAEINDIHFSHNDNSVIACADDNTLRVWEINSGKLVQLYVFKDHEVLRFQISPRGEYVLFLTCFELHVARLSSGERIISMKRPGEHIRIAQFCSDGTLLESFSTEQCIVTRDIAQNKLLEKVQSPNTHLFAKCSPDKRIIFARSSFKDIEMWNFTTGEPTQRLIGHFDAITNIDVSPNGKLLVSSSQDNTIRLWG
ncbi:WD-40 repeat-containing protein [Reticulomyxa filosa]|uniref:WD-40 repeat-containing protein n=1 Tax=Reticulomyxa filosa TaxID=46433 RepID=X6NBK9_RETFI|nr:WD-40 repeat-containing protein [Reticulomyxa filosa]|eukprot:ETO23164.1 WD-40 repeat-containing protein [Reticulomyxa filosa]